MHPLKQQLVDVYYQATRPYRALWMRQACAARRAPVMILFYHRVADDRAERLDLLDASSSRDRCNGFDEHCDVVDAGRSATPPARRERSPGRLRDVRRRLRRQQRLRPAAARSRTAFPARTSSRCRTRRPAIRFRTTSRSASRCDRTRSTTCAAGPTRGIEIGAHTRTHPDIGTHPRRRDRLYDEIVVAGRELGDAVDRPIRYFAFPFGLPANMQPRGVRDGPRGRLRRRSARPTAAYNLPGDDPFHLQRIHADDDFARFRNWLTVDPRKLNVPLRATTPVARRRIARATH